METKKKAIEWLNMLNEPERSQAIQNCIDLDGYHLNLKDCIVDSFSWAKSHEGFSYWQDIVLKIEDGSYEFKNHNIKVGTVKDFKDNPDIYKLIDQLIKEGKNQGYKISVTIE